MVQPHTFLSALSPPSGGQQKIEKKKRVLPVSVVWWQSEIT